MRGKGGSMKGNFLRTKNMEKVNIVGKMGLFFKEISSKMLLTVRVNYNMEMEGFMRDSSRMPKWKDMVSFSGMMVKFIREIMLTIKRRVMVNFIGVMVIFIEDSLRMVKNMEREN